MGTISPCRGRSDPHPWYGSQLSDTRGCALLPTRTYVTHNSFTNNSFDSNLLNIMFYSNSFPGHLISTKFYTCHDSTVVMCKICNNQFVKIQIKAKHFLSNLNYERKSLPNQVVYGPDNRDPFHKSFKSSKLKLCKKSFNSVWFWWSNQFTILQMPRQLSCGGMCKIVNWWDHYSSHKSNIFFNKTWIRSSWRVGESAAWIPQYHMATCLFQAFQHLHWI